MKPGMPPPSAPAHCWDHPPVAGTMQPQQPMGLQPGAAVRGQPLQPTGSCPLQAPSHPGPSTVLQGPPVQQQVHLVPGTLPTIFEQEEEPFGDAVVHTEDQEQPAPISMCPHPTMAPLTCSIAALESGAATTSSDIPEDITDIGDLLAWMNSGEFGGSRAGGGVFAPIWCGKAGLNPVVIFFLFQKWHPKRSRTTSRAWMLTRLSAQPLPAPPVGTSRALAASKPPRGSCRRGKMLQSKSAHARRSWVGSAKTGASAETSPCGAAGDTAAAGDIANK
ncbi:uncharacterized protein LOC128074433 isoform X1 [Tympanuchus pallidicinctus]|uniref:uncharacterized protein LOC128074433 isoform X1 n=1 Tax=Tympanuchus pallidicinctus TaxID=109042 RepID=UPI002286E7D4|nr:uncharacterized protein LOC128074433 isoform X1 [Tympanuchus pallidicinctus]